MKDNYLTIEQPTEGLFKDRGSKFLAYAYPVETEEDIKIHLLRLKKLHPKVRHICYAYRLGLDNNNYRANDDGEPSGTAGKPILGQIDSFKVTNVLVAVARYFGGTKLGVGGLINAYRTAAAEALNEAYIIEKVIKDTFRLKVSYDTLNPVMRFLKKEKYAIANQNFGAQVFLDIQTRQSESQLFLDKWNEYALTVGLTKVVRVKKLK